MPIIRTYACVDCMHQMDVVLTMEQVDDPPPECPRCAARETQQVFKPVNIGGSVQGRAGKLAEDILEHDYQVADMNRPHEGDKRKVRYKDQTPATPTSSWGIAQEALQGAIAAGRQMRLQHGSGLDVLKANLESGAQQDLIEVSKRRSVKVW